MVYVVVISGDGSTPTLEAFAHREVADAYATCARRATSREVRVEPRYVRGSGLAESAR